MQIQEIIKVLETDLIKAKFSLQYTLQKKRVRTEEIANLEKKIAAYSGAIERLKAL